jgi:hypothetical protein
MSAAMAMRRQDVTGLYVTTTLSGTSMSTRYAPVSNHVDSVGITNRIISDYQRTRTTILYPLLAMAETYRRWLHENSLMEELGVYQKDSF